MQLLNFPSDNGEGGEERRGYCVFLCRVSVSGNGNRRSIDIARVAETMKNGALGESSSQAAAHDSQTYVYVAVSCNCQE